MSEPIKLIAGLGNPGEKYRGSRHNAGADFVAALAGQYGASFTTESRFFGLVSHFVLLGQQVRLLIPATFMNRSGQAVSAMARYYKIATPNLLVAHDELDFEPGTARWKESGGHGGHNGLRDIVKALDENFLRLRIGIGHPGPGFEVIDYVLGQPSQVDRLKIANSIDRSLDALPLLLRGEWVKATAQLHRSP